MALFNPLPMPPGLPPILSPKSSVGAKPHLVDNGIPDEIGQLLPTNFRGIDFPCELFSEKNSNTLVVHLYPNQDNARVENTGFDPREWELIIPLTNNIYPSKSEDWIPGTLFPQVWNQLQTALQDKSSGILNHPQIGKVICKVRNWTYKYQGDKERDGVIVTVNFIECIDDTITIQQTISTPLFDRVITAASTLDDAISNPLNDPRLAPPGLNLLGAFTQIATYIKTVLAYPNSVINSVNATILAFTSTTQATVNNIVNSTSVLANTAVNSANAIINANLNLPFNIYNNENQTYQSNNAVQFNVVVNQKTRNNTNISSQYNTITYNGRLLGNVLTAYQNCYGTANTNATQILNKAVNFSQATLSYYQGLNNYTTAAIEQGLLSFISSLYATLKQVQATTTTAYSVLSLVTATAITFFQIAKLTNNTIDQIMELNPSVSKLIFVPINTTMNYYSSTGN